MPNNWLTDEAVELEIARLQQSDYVKLAHKEVQLKYKRRKYLYQLRHEEKRGKQLAAAGITMQNIETMIAQAEKEVEEVTTGGMTTI